MQAYINDAFGRHDKIAFQFSGGKDSLAALYLLKPYWDRMTVYHCDAGDQFPETEAVVSEIAKQVPKFVVIEGRVFDVWDEFGFPTDVIPTYNTQLGRMVKSGRELKLIDRYTCCFLSLMIPMHNRMIEDGITMIVRGQKDVDYKTPPYRTGDYGDGFEFLYPIEDWTDEETLKYLEDIGVEPPAFYRHGITNSPECMVCTAWLDEKKADYMKDCHPLEYRVYQKRLKLIKAEIDHALEYMNSEME
jgi:phosphoadenosine phosphosulfate reductase